MITPSDFDSEAARLAWQGLSDEDMRLIIKAAFKGKRVPEGDAGDVALGWAWVIIGPPWMRRHDSIGAFLLAYLRASGQKGYLYWIRMAGYPDNDLLPIVRRAARAVEKAYYSNHDS